MSQKPWYHEGLPFTCTQCGDCCSGAPGYVWVVQEEIDGLAAKLGHTSDEFERLFVRKVGIRRSLKEYPDGDCLLLDPDTRKCTAYEARPASARPGRSGTAISRLRKPGRGLRSLPGKSLR
ncbi:MAG: YkgJ family cysteine cluster protein [Pirellulaceae bacterium]